MLKEMFELESFVVKSFTGIETKPNEIVAEASARAPMGIIIGDSDKHFNPVPEPISVGPAREAASSCPTG